MRNKVKELYQKGLSDYEMKPDVTRSLSGFVNWTGFALRIGAHINRAFLEVEAEDFETSG